MASSPPSRAPDPQLDRVKRLARLLDTRFLDPILGFVLPGAGDLLGSLLGIYTIVLAVRRKMSPAIVARLLMNLALDAAIGIFPVVGDLIDVGFKAHTRNVALLTARAETGGRAAARDWAYVGLAVLLFLATLGLTIYALAALLRAVA